MPQLKELLSDSRPYPYREQGLRMFYGIIEFGGEVRTQETSSYLTGSP